jgi:hypothetical protein
MLTCTEVNLLDRIDIEILNLFKRYLEWIQNNKFKDTLNNYNFYVSYIENVNGYKLGADRKLV